MNRRPLLQSHHRGRPDSVRVVRTFAFVDGEPTRGENPDIASAYILACPRLRPGLAEPVCGSLGVEVCCCSSGGRGPGSRIGGRRRGRNLYVDENASIRRPVADVAPDTGTHSVAGTHALGR
jgi:hypothetical protein